MKNNNSIFMIAMKKQILIALVINFPAVFRELKRQDYKGSFSIEHESNWEHNAGDVIQIVHFYYDNIKKL